MRIAMQRAALQKRTNVVRQQHAVLTQQHKRKTAELYVTTQTWDRTWPLRCCFFPFLSESAFPSGTWVSITQRSLVEAMCFKYTTGHA